MTLAGCYKAYSLVIGSELPLPSLPRADGNPDIVVRFGKVARVARKASLNEELAFNRLAGAFRISNGEEIVIDPLPGVDSETVQVVLLGRIMAFLLRQRGWLSLHASGVTVNGAGILFLGSIGSGKSTLAAAFHAHGHVVITDDVAPVRVQNGDCIVMTTRQRLRLDSRSLSLLKDASAAPELDKYAVDVARGTPPDTLSLNRIYSITDDEDTGIAARPVAPAASVRLLSAHSFFRRRRMDEASVRAHLRDCAAVVSSVPVRELIRPRRLGSLPDLVRFVERDAGNDG